MGYHRLLNRQLRRSGLDVHTPSMQTFLEMVDSYYQEVDQERKLLEHTLEVSSKELTEANRKIKQESQETKNAILNALHVALVAVNESVEIVFANENACELLGFEHAVLESMNFAKLLVNDDELSESLHNRAFNERIEGRSLIKNGEKKYVPVHYSVYPMMHYGKQHGVVISLQDIRKTIEDEVLIKLQSAAIENAANMILISDESGNITYANQEYYRFNGVTQESVIGSKVPPFSDGKGSVASESDELVQALKKDKVWRGTLKGRKHSGEPFFEEVSVTPLLSGNVVSNYVIVKKDVTERIRYEEDLKVAKDKALQASCEMEKAMLEAKRANKAKDIFLSNMSHELRTPLNAILGFSQILKKKNDTPSKIKEYLEKIFIAGSSLLNIVNTILDFSKIESGKIEYKPEKFLLERLMQDVLAICEPLAEKKAIALQFKYESEMILYADIQLLKQTLVNLLYNAIKFSEEAGSIEIQVRKKTDKIKFSVIDHGMGIEGSQLGKLFMPFEQVDSSHSQSGTGLGLSICKKIVEMHKGRIWVESTLGEGSRFYFTIANKGE